MNAKTIATFIAITLGVLLGVGGLLWQFGQGGVKPIEGVAGESRYVKGDGEIIITEFSDFQCPGCAQAQPKLKEVLAKYEGKVRMVYRHFPLTSIHRHALAAAYAAEAAYLQGKFWEMHDILFERQSQWANMGDPKQKFGEYAEEIGMNSEQFENDMQSESVKAVVARDLTDATRYRLRGTPSFFVNGIPTEGDIIETKLQQLVK